MSVRPNSNAPRILNAYILPTSLAGDFPREQLRLVQAWIELHRDELMTDWELALNEETPYKIAPL